MDDEEDNREIVAAVLAQDGFDLAFASGGSEALETIAVAPPDLVLLDLAMPGMTGLDVARRLKDDARTCAIPIIILTALHEQAPKLAGLHIGAEEFLTKPIDQTELRLRVRNLLRLKAYADFHDRNSQVLEAEVGVRSAEVAERDQLYHSTFEQAPIGIAHVALNGKLVRVNKRWCAMAGRTADQLLGDAGTNDFFAVLAAADVEALEQLARGVRDQYVIEELSYLRDNGQWLWIRVNISLHHDVTLRPLHFIAVIEDITERRALEAQVRQSNRMEGIGRLAAGIAHDFNNLLSVVLTYSDLLSSDLRPEDPMRADLGEIRLAGQRAVDLTRQLLAFSRQQVLKPRVINLNDVVSGMDRMLRRIVGADVELSVTTLTALDAVLVDPGQMEQVIMNLVVNARDAMPRGGKITIETSNLTIDEVAASSNEGARSGAHVVLDVSDNGVGMDEATQAHMFEPFYTTKELGRGTGLGLATVFGIVKQSGGAISVRSAPGQGTTFRLYFPRAKDGVAVTYSIVPPASARLQGAETILLVEREDQVRKLACAVLRKYGYNVLEARSAGDALLVCEQWNSTIHLLITEIVMPQMNGRQLAERALGIRPAMKVLYMSGYADDPLLGHGPLHPAAALLPKPFASEDLARSVREALSNDALKAGG